MTNHFPHLIYMISRSRYNNGFNKRRALDSSDRMNQKRHTAYFKELLGKINSHPVAETAGGDYCGSCGHIDQKKTGGGYKPNPVPP